MFQLWAALVLLALEPKVGSTHAHNPHSMRWPDRPRHVPRITVVELRQRPAASRHGAPDDEDGGESWHLTHQHLVRGHWRQQACGPGLKWRKPVYIAPYIKGPEGSGLTQTDVVHVCRR